MSSITHFGVSDLKSELRVRMKLKQKIRTQARRVRDMNEPRSEFRSQIWLYGQISDVGKEDWNEKTGLANLIVESVSQRLLCKHRIGHLKNWGEHESEGVEVVFGGQRSGGWMIQRQTQRIRGREGESRGTWSQKPGKVRGHPRGGRSEAEGGRCRW